MSRRSALTTRTQRLRDLCPLAPRPEDHRGSSHPVGEEAGGRDDPHCVLPECLRSHRPAALHGQPAAEVRPQHGPLHQQHGQQPQQQQHFPLQQQDLVLLGRVCQH